MNKVLVTGHRGMVGSNVARVLREQGRDVVTTECDLCDPESFGFQLRALRPDAIINCAARVGGIGANMKFPATFINTNLRIQDTILNCARGHDLKVVLLGSSCIYPVNCPQPIKEEYLLSGPLEPTNLPYAISKIAGLVMGQAYRRQYGMNVIGLIPCNLYGPGDTFHAENSHLLPAMLMKMHSAKKLGEPSVTLWGDGTPRRELLDVRDCAEAIALSLDRYDDEQPLNIGTGIDHSIAEIADVVKEVVDFKGEVVWDTSRPNGVKAKLLDVSRINSLGWTAQHSLFSGVENAYRWYLENK